MDVNRQSWGVYEVKEKNDPQHRHLSPQKLCKSQDCSEKRTTVDLRQEHTVSLQHPDIARSLRHGDVWERIKHGTAPAAAGPAAEAQQTEALYPQRRFEPTSL